MNGPSPGLVVARIAAFVALLAGALMVLEPFLVAMTWAAILAYVTWPLYRWLQAHTRRPRLAAVLFTLAIAFGVGIPVVWLLVNLANEANQLVRAFGAWAEQGGELPTWMAEREWLAAWVERGRATGLGDPTTIVEWLDRYGGRVSGRLMEIVGGVARNLFKFGIAVFTLYFFYTDGERIAAASRELARLLFPVAPLEFFESIGQAVRGVMFGLLGTAFVQSVLAASAYAVAGVPAPLALGAATFMLSFIPGGATAVSFGAAVWLVLQDRIGWAIGVALWGLLVIASMDNVLRPILISGPTRIPLLLVFLGVIGGLASLGLIGIFVGPVLLSVAFTLVMRFSHMSAEGEPAPETADREAT